MPLVVGTDLSEQSLEAVRAALAIATRRGDAEIHLVHVLDDDTAQDAGESGRDAMVASARARLDADAARLAAGTSIQVRTDVLIGPADEALMALADTEQADLVIVTSQGHTSSPLRRLGGVSEQLAVRASRPLLVVRDAAPLLAWASGERPLRVLVGLDESAVCQGALAFVRGLRRAGPVDVIVGHVYFPDEAAHRYGMRGISMVEPTPELERLITRDLTRRVGEMPGDGQVVIAPRLGLGRVGDHMLEVADANDVDLIVVGTHRKAGLSRLSSVSAVILHHGKPSVVCVPLSADTAVDDVPRLRVIVVATDCSAFGNLAIPWAYAMAGEGGEVHMVHVVEDRADADDEARISSLLELAPPSRMSVLTRAHVVHGDDPARTIAEAAERIGADAICIASHGRSGISRALVGSVADKLIRESRRPVLVLRPIT